MSHNWISCRNAPLSALLTSARAPFPPGSPLLRRALNGAWGSSQTISLLLNDIPVLIQYHTRLSPCLNPNPCHHFPWTGDCTWHFSLHLTNSFLSVPPEEQGMELQNSPWCPLLSALFPLTCLTSSSLQIPSTHTWVSLTCLGNTVRWSASNYKVLM